MFVVDTVTALLVLVTDDHSHFIRTALRNFKGASVRKQWACGATNMCTACGKQLYGLYKLI